MKKSLILILSLAFFFLNFSAKAQITADLLDKKWQVEFDVYEHIRNMNESQWAAYSKLSVSKRREIESQMKKDAASSLFEFKSDFTFKVSKSGELLEEGKWMIQSDGKTIIAKNDNGFEDKITLLEVSPQKMIISSEQYGQNVTLIPLKKEN